MILRHEKLGCKGNRLFHIKSKESPQNTKFAYLWKILYNYSTFYVITGRYYEKKIPNASKLFIMDI